ncbi:MAG: VTT domain-containing protein [Candidatus Lokiarchaeota archaeon]|nr:VTT domain-containing protein [Candidatus Lokiarchaeota archaeon]
MKITGFLKKYSALVIISTIILFFLIIALMGINFGQWLADIVIYFYDISGEWGIYLGVFLISIFGNFTIIFPVPYLIALVVISAILPVNPITLGLIGGLGACIGEIISWTIGNRSKNLIRNSEKFERMKKYIEKGWAPLLIIFFAATPLPDDAFLIVLGIVNYSLAKTLIYCFIGKFILCFLCSALPIWLANTALGDFLFSLVGIDLEAAQTGIILQSTPIDLLISSMTWISVIVIIFLIIYVDWNMLLRKWVNREVKIFKNKKALKE